MPNLYTEKYFLNIVNVNQIWIVIKLSSWFGIKRNFAWCQISQKCVITIEIWFGLTKSVNFSQAQVWSLEILNYKFIKSKIWGWNIRDSIKTIILKPKTYLKQICNQGDVNRGPHKIRGAGGCKQLTELNSPIRGEFIVSKYEFKKKLAVGKFFVSVLSLANATVSQLML